MYIYIYKAPIMVCIYTGNLLFHKVNEKCRLSRNEHHDKNIRANNAIISTTHRLILFCKSEQGWEIINSISNYINQILPENHVAQHVYRSRKLALHLI